MHIAVVGRFPPPIDGQSTATRRLSRLLSAHHQVTDLDIQPREEPVRAATGVTWHRALHFLRLRSNLLARMKESAADCTVWPAISPDLFGHVRDMVSVLPALDRSSPIIAVVHRGNFDKLFRSKATGISAKKLVSDVSAFVFLTENLSARCVRWIPKHKHFVIPNAIDEEVEFTAEEVQRSQEARRNRAEVIVLFLSNMHRSKGYLELLESAQELMHTNAPVSFRFVGAWQSAEDQSEFRHFVSRHGISNVEHLGPVADRVAIKRLYNDCDIVALPTYYPDEAQPLSLIEAMSAGRPVVATRHAGIPEMIVDGREGLLVGKRDGKALAQAIVRMTNYADWLQYARASRARYVRQFAPDRVYSQWASLLSSMRPINSDSNR